MAVQLATLADVKRMLHRDQNDISIDDAIGLALETAEAHVKIYLRQDYSLVGGLQNTATFYDRPEDSKVPVPVVGANIMQVRLYRTPSATAYVAKPLIDYEVQHDGLQPPANLVVTANPSGGTFTAGTYFWVVTTLNAAGETNGSNEYSIAVVNGGTATVAMQLYGGEQFIRIYRVTAQGTETSNASCLVGQFAVNAGVPIPGQTGGPLSVAFIDTGTATVSGIVPIFNATTTIPPRWVRLHPTVFDVPFEGAVSQHYPDNWSRVEVDYVPPQQVPTGVRDGTAMTAAAIYLRSTITASGFTEERLGDYLWSTRSFHGGGDQAQNEVIPEVAKALLRPWRRREGLTV